MDIEILTASMDKAVSHSRNSHTVREGSDILSGRRAFLMKCKDL